jgi:integrase
MAQRITARLVQSKTPGVFNDSVVPGLRFIIGTRTRTFRVSPRIGGTQHNIKVYTVTASSLKEAGEQLTEAREKARQILLDASRGIDPQQAERAAKRAALLEQRNTFAQVAGNYMAEKGQHLKSGAELQRKLDKLILPTLGDIPVADLTRADIKELFLEKAEAKPVAANRMLALINVILNYAIDEELIDNNPATRIEKKSETPRDRYLSAVEIATFWHGLDNIGFDPQIVRILKLCLASGQRRAEVVHMRWSEINLAETKWELPAERTKAGRPHRVPLSPLAVELIGEPTGGEYVFTNGGGRPFHLNAPGQAMAASLPALGLADNPATPHDLRRTFASGMGDLGIPPYVVSRLLNHSMPGITERVYYLTALAGEKETAMDAWGAKLTEIATGKTAPENVVPIKGAAG